MNHKEHQPAGIRYAAFARLCAGLLAAFALTGCLTSTPIAVDDRHAFIRSARVDISLKENKQPAAEPQTGHAVEFEYVKTRGGSNQTLTTGQAPIWFNNTVFNAPQQIRNDFDMNYVDLSYRWRKFFWERAVGLEMTAGVGHASLGLTMSSPAQQASGRYTSYGAQGGIGMIWRLQPSTSLHARIVGFVANATPGISDFGRYELFISQALGDTLALRAGYAKWEVNGRGGSGASDFRVTFVGPVLDIGLNF
jgi:hypothetical protein